MVSWRSWSGVGMISLTEGRGNVGLMSWGEDRSDVREIS